MSANSLFYPFVRPCALDGRLLFALCSFVPFVVNPPFFDLRSSAQICDKSLVFNSGDFGNHGNSGNFFVPLPPPPMFNPIEPKGTQENPSRGPQHAGFAWWRGRLKDQAEGYNPKMQKTRRYPRLRLPNVIQALHLRNSCGTVHEYRYQPLQTKHEYTLAQFMIVPIKTAPPQLYLAIAGRLLRSKKHPYIHHT